MYEIIRFYVEADIANKDIQPTTAAHKTEVLERVFQTLVSEYGVSVYDDRIEGLTERMEETDAMLEKLRDKRY